MNMRKMLFRTSLGVAIFAGGFIAAQAPLMDVDPHRHPNLAAAQRSCDQAFADLDRAQRANEWDMSGHGSRAKQLLQDASREIKLAAQSANRPGRR